MECDIKISIETKQLNEIFSVYKDIQKIGSKVNVFYGLCFNEEVERFKEFLIFPEEGSKYKLVPKGIEVENFEDLEMQEFFEKDVDLQDYAFIKKSGEEFVEYKK